ncbi:MAG: DUF559 domain-containing protein [Clostridia bacterium]|nr:DUF559 domain-containing protein [Clostridia bacterium]
MERKHNKKLVPLAKSLRKNMTPEEKHLWYDFLRKHPARFTRQKVFGRYIADFYSAKARLVVEVDGSWHYAEDAQAHDNERTAYMEKYGVRVFRIDNSEINRDFDNVCAWIDDAVREAIPDINCNKSISN